MGELARSKIDKWLEKDNLMLLTCWARDGYKDAQIAERMGVGETTLSKWKGKYPQIAEALAKGKEIVDYQVENALLKSALGYTTEEVKTIISPEVDKQGNRKVRIEKTTKEIAPNVTAIMCWLNNRKPDLWKRNRDNVLSTTDDDSNITVNIIRQSPSKKKAKAENEVDEEAWNVDVEKQDKELTEEEIKEQKRLEKNKKIQASNKKKRERGNLDSSNILWNKAHEEAIKKNNNNENNNKTSNSKQSNDDLEKELKKEKKVLKRNEEKSDEELWNEVIEETEEWK